MVKASPHKRQKGCGLCSPHKHRGNGDTVRLLSPSVMRQVGVDARWNRHSVAPPPDWPEPSLDADLDPADDCRHGCNGRCVRYGSERCDFTCHPAWNEMFPNRPEED